MQDSPLLSRRLLVHLLPHSVRRQKSNHFLLGPFHGEAPVLLALGLHQAVLRVDAVLVIGLLDAQLCKCEKIRGRRKQR